MKVGDKVGYSVQFLKSIGMLHGDMAAARGVIESINAIGSEIQLAEINWGKHDMPKRVNVKNLALVGPNRRFCNVD